MAFSLITTEAEPLLNKPPVRIEQGGMVKSQEYSTISDASTGIDLPRQARLTARQAFTGSLATLDREGGYPFASLVSVAVSAAGDPIFLLSGLARHTKNIADNGKASVLLEAPIASGDPLAASRVSLQGDVQKTRSNVLRTRFLSRHPEAAGYADFKDFAFYELKVSTAHFIAGFGRIHSFDRSAVCLTTEECGHPLDQEQCALLGKSHKDQLMTAWRRQVGTGPREEELEIIAVDGDGLDVRCGEALQRLNFNKVVDCASTDVNAHLPELLGIQVSGT